MDKLEFQKRPDKGNITFTLRISNTTNKKLEEIAHETGISRNNIVNRMISFGLRNYRIHNGARGEGDEQQD